MSDREPKHEEWRECAEWLNEFRVLPDDHVTLTPNANPINLIQALQDGVVLCNLAVNISGGEIDLKAYNTFNSDPQNSQFLCCHNIQLFLDLCRDYFKLKETLLFSVNDLYQASNFGKVISLLSELSKHSLALRRQVQDFSSKSQNNNNAVEANKRQEYNFEDTIYDTVLYQGHAKKVSHSTPRDHCVKEIIDTEKNYVDLLNMLLENYKKPLANVLSDQELSEIFKHIDKLYLVHKELYRNLLLATQSESPPFTLSQVFIKIRDSLLIYGEYSGHLLRAKSLVRDIVNNDEEKKKKIDLCRESADDKCKFELVELLTVPMQRVLKYHLLLEQLCKLTDNENTEKASLLEAHSAMKDLADFTNEVKRDLDMINSINRIQECLEDLYFPANKSLKSYGRLLMDGELRISVEGENKIKIRYVFLFERMILICKQKGQNFTFMKAYFVTTFPFERIDSPAKKNNKQWTYGFRLTLTTEKDKSLINFYAKSEDIRTGWVNAIEIARENVCPPGARDKNYFFELFDFPEYAYCSICKKILKGSFFQGYRCKLSGLIAHKACLVKNDLKPFQPQHPPAPPTPKNSIVQSNKVTIQQFNLMARPLPSSINGTTTGSSMLLPTVINCGMEAPGVTGKYQQMGNNSTNQVNSSGYNSSQISRNISNVSSNTPTEIIPNEDGENLYNRSISSHLRRRSSVNDSAASATPPGSTCSGNRTKQMATPNQSPLHSNHSSFCGNMALVIKPFSNSNSPDYNLVFGETVTVLQTKQSQSLVQKDNRLEFWVPSAILESILNISSDSQRFPDQSLLFNENNSLHISNHLKQLSSHRNQRLSFDSPSDNQTPSTPPSNPIPITSHDLHNNNNTISSCSATSSRRHTTDLHQKNSADLSFSQPQSVRCTSLNQGFMRSSVSGMTTGTMLINQMNRMKINEDLYSFPWFLGNMDRNEALSLLHNCDNGTFLVRVSQNHERLGEFSLSLVYQEPRHIRIHRKYPNPNDLQQIVFYLSPTKNFSSISALIEHYQKNSLETCFEGICTSLLYPYIRCPNLINPLLAQVMEDFNPDEEYQTINPTTDIYAQISLLKGELIVIMVLDLERNGFCGYCQGWRRGRIGVFPKHLLNISNLQ